MKRSSTRRGGNLERRKKPRGSRKKTAPVDQKLDQKPTENCQNCGTDLTDEERAVFVEEEVGRVFCSETCIAAYFTPEIEKLEKEYFRRLSSSDLSAEERNSLAHLRWITLEQPDEVWREKTLSGDFRYTLISEFEPGNRKIWCVCICLFLRGEPSFLYLAFPTRNEAMADKYRRGERVEWVKPEKAAGRSLSDAGTTVTDPHFIDGLADSWTPDETLRAQLIQERSKSDIPASEFGEYQSLFQETLEAPDEVWTSRVGGENELKIYHFIRHYAERKPLVWYIVLARETEDEEQLEILDAFPTRDSSLVDRYRRGQQEIGSDDLGATPPNRVVH